MTENGWMDPEHTNTTLLDMLMVAGLLRRFWFLFCHSESGSDTRLYELHRTDPVGGRNGKI